MEAGAGAGARGMMTTDEHQHQEHLLPGEENMLIKGVSSEGLLR